MDKISAKRGIKLIAKNPLSDDDIKNILGEDIKIIKYPDIKNLQSVDELFDKNGRCILFYPILSDAVGHWVALINHTDRIEFFDPYGKSPESLRINIPKEQQKLLDMAEPYLIHLLSTSTKPVFYNNHCFQKHSNSNLTCGRHAAVRLLYYPYDLEHYNNIIKKSKMSADDFVSAVIFNKIKK